MRFSVAAILGLAAIASAQSSNVTSAASSAISSAAAAPSTSATLSPEQVCLKACAYNDICCQAACVNVPCPSPLQVNATTDCAMQCPQGNGTKQETDQYAACQAQCVSSYFFSSGAPAATGSARASGNAGATTTGAGASRTDGASSTASATQNAAPEVRFGAAGLGLLGLIAAGLAM